jgi:hypothetical protein
MRRASASFVAILFLAACGTTQSVRPLGAGSSAVDFSLGGPLLGADVGAPVPLMLVGYRYGLDDRSDLFGRLHVLPAVGRVLALELGGSRLLSSQRGRLVPALSVSVQGLVVASAGAVLGVPAASLNASWSMRPWLLYVGSQQALSFGRRLDGSGAALHWAPYAGATVDLRRWTVGAELRWWDPHVGRDVLVWWQGIGRRGALAPMLSISRRLGGHP